MRQKTQMPEGFAEDAALLTGKELAEKYGIGEWAVYRLRKELGLTQEELYKQRTQYRRLPAPPPDPATAAKSPAGPVRVGCTVTRRLHSLILEDHLPKKMTGTVVWVHPLGRFHVVRFDLGQGRSFLESFRGVDIAQEIPAAAPPLPQEKEGYHYSRKGGRGGKT